MTIAMLMHNTVRAAELAASATGRRAQSES